MNSYMTIQVRIQANRAQAVLSAIRGEVGMFGASVTRANGQTPLGTQHIASLRKMGSQLQWTGRMLEYNFTLPIIAAIGLATKFQLANEKAMVQVTKVYGDSAAATAYFTKNQQALQEVMKKHPEVTNAAQAATATFKDELNALQGAFEALSNEFGVNLAKVNEIGGAWAAAGVSGVALAKSVKNTLIATVLGDMDATKATAALISIQAQYNLSSKELTKTLYLMNSVENQTATSMQDLIVGFSKVAGIARVSGVDVRYLAADIAALVPAAGSAANAGNALKTIFTRLIKPTGETNEVLGAIGIKTKSLAWQSANTQDRLLMMSKAFEKLGGSAQGVVAATVASTWQVSRFSQLMDELGKKTGYYQKALDASASTTQNYKTAVSELNAVLTSNPQRLQQMWVMLQNAMANIVQPLIPLIIMLAQKIAELAQWFEHLNPMVQNWVLVMALVLAAVGPIQRYLGALLGLYAVLASWVIRLVGVFGLFGRALMLLGAPFRFVIAATGMMIDAFMVAFGALTPIVSAAFAPLIGIVRASMTGIMATTMALQTFWIGFWAGVEGIFVAAYSALTLLSTAFGVAWIEAQAAAQRVAFVLWYAFARTMEVAHAGWAAARVGIEIAFGATWIALQRTFQAAWFAVWYAGSLAIEAMQIAFGGSLRMIWITISTALINISVATTRGIALAWAGLQGILPLLSAIGVAMVAALTNPWTYLVIAVIAVLSKFHDQISRIFSQIGNNVAASGSGIVQVWNNVVSAIASVFNKLPESVQNAMVSVAKIIQQVALEVYDWFSYINPFAHHSPSLVENVTNGMSTVISQFGRLKAVKGTFTDVYSDIAKFGQQTAGLDISSKNLQRKSDISALKKAGAGGAVALYTKLSNEQDILTKRADKLNNAIRTQQGVVDGLQKKVDAVNKVLEKAKDKLSALQDVLSGYKDKLSEAQDRLQSFANAPLKGMGEMNDQIEANLEAQNKLQLAMMNMEDVTGTLDQINSKLQAIQGTQELLNGKKSDLRAAGAGSEILGQYDQQLNALDKQAQAYKENASQLQNMQDQLDALSRAADKLNLMKDVNFGPLQYQIDKLANSTKELSFDQIVTGIKQAQGDITKYSGLVDQATKAVDAQQAVVDAAQDKYDKINGKLDTQQEKLNNLKDTYSQINDQINAIGSALSDVTDKAQKALEAKKKKKGDAGSIGLQDLKAAGNASFPEVGGKNGMSPRTDWASQTDAINKFTQQQIQDTSDLLGKFNPFEPLKAKAKAAWLWIKNQASLIFGGMGDIFSHMFDGTGLTTDGITAKIKPIGDKLNSAVSAIIKGIADLWKLFGPDIIKTATEIWDSIVDGVRKISPQLLKLGQALGPSLKIIIGVALLLAKVLTKVISEAIGPFLDAIFGIATGIVQALAGVFEVINGALDIIVGIFTLNGDKIAKGFGEIFSGLVDIVAGVFRGIWSAIKGFVSIIWNVVEGMVKGIADFFLWLKYVLIGDPIVYDLLDGIRAAWETITDLGQWIWDHVLKPIVDFFVFLWDSVVAGLNQWGAWIKAAWNGLMSLGQWVWDNVLKPVVGFYVQLWSSVKTELDSWWGKIKGAWNALTGLAGWVWDNVLFPILNKFKSIWTDHISPELASWWNKLTGVWDTLTKLGGWFGTNVLDPIKNAFVTTFTAIKNWFTDKLDWFMAPIHAVVRGVTDAMNFIISGINLLDKLPGISIHIDPIVLPKGFAEGTDMLPMGGRRANRGFKTTGARAIVGEGKPNYPEFVIPTDPTHRRRALSLLGMAGTRLGVSLNGAAGDTPKDMARVIAENPGGPGIPKFGIGGWLGSVASGAMGLGGDTISWTADKLKSAGISLKDGVYHMVVNGMEIAFKSIKEAVSVIMSPYISYARSKAKNANWEDLGGNLAGSVADGAQAWTNNYNDAYGSVAKAAISANVSGALNWARSQVGKPYIWGGVGPEGYDCSGFMSALTNVLHGKSPYSRVGATSSFPWAGFSGYNGQDLKTSFVIGSTQSYAGGVGHMAGTLGGVNVESRGGVGPIVGSAARGYTDSGFDTHAGIYGLKYGGIVRRRAGGILANIGEGSHDEAVTPLPNGWQSSLFNKGASGGGDVYIYGNLEFPNITDPEDAETFINNLKGLAGGN